MLSAPRKSARRTAGFSRANTLDNTKVSLAAGFDTSPQRVGTAMLRSWDWSLSSRSMSSRPSGARAGTQSFGP